MGKVIAFPDRGAEDIDLLSAVEFAIRDLRDIASRSDACREQADASQRMLEAAYRAALSD